MVQGLACKKEESRKERLFKNCANLSKAVAMPCSCQGVPGYTLT